MSLQDLKSALTETVDNVWRYRAPANASVPYAVWAEDSRNDFTADGRHVEISWQGTIDYFTRVEDDPAIDDIEDMLTDLDLTWYLNSVQYEEETGVIHYEWVWNI